MSAYEHAARPGGGGVDGGGERALKKEACSMILVTFNRTATASLALMFSPIAYSRVLEATEPFPSPFPLENLFRIFFFSLGENVSIIVNETRRNRWGKKSLTSQRP